MQWERAEAMNRAQTTTETLFGLKSRPKRRLSVVWAISMFFIRLMACFCGDRREIKFFKMTKEREKEKKGRILETYIDVQ
jgi:hypothetical protein